MPIGILQSSLEPDDPAKSFKLASQAGGEGIELVCAKDERTPAGLELRSGKDEHVEAMLSPAGAKRIRQLKTKFGLEVPGIALRVLSKTESLFGEPPVVSAAEELIQRAMQTAREVGAPVVLLPFFGKATIELEKELDRVGEALQELAEEAEEKGLTLGIQTTLNVDLQLHLMDHLATYPSVKICFDTAIPLARKFDPATSLRDLGRQRICQMQFRDVRLGDEGSPPEWNVALGAGEVDFPAIANAMEAMAYDGWSIAAAPAMDDPLSAAKASVGFVRQLLGQA